jgi:hypothetical protein
MNRSQRELGEFLNEEGFIGHKGSEKTNAINRQDAKTPREENTPRSQFRF